MTETSPPARARPRPRGAGEWVRAALLTAGFAGYSPWFPGTCGTAVALGVYLGVRTFPASLLLPACLVVALAATAGCVLLGPWAERFFGRKDPQAVVLDEVAGFFLAVAGVEPRLGGGWVLACFVLFRFFDMAKPLGIRRLQALPAGWGIAVDDLVAALYANLLVQVLGGVLS
ncbi:MAG: phosphatidylglycerophosphatase A [Planctomycetes bacterium]|nr:phosphatidylglycerophosphatase A [Planctomycetota bacterium]